MTTKDNELHGDITADENSANFPQEDEQRKAQRRTKNAKGAQHRQRAVERHQRTTRNLRTTFEEVDGRQFYTPLANIVEAMFLLCSLPQCPETEEALELTQRAYVLLDKQNLIPSVRHTNSRNDQRASSRPHQDQAPGPDQPLGSRTGGGRPSGKLVTPREAKVLMSRSWTRKKASSPHEPSGSWFLAIQSMQEGNCGPSAPSSFFKSATHAVSYGEKLMSPPPIDVNAALTVPIISSMCLGSPFIHAMKISALFQRYAPFCYLCANI
jgi:hypothetical protein